MGQLTIENENRISDLEKIIKINTKMIRILEKEKYAFLAKGLNSMDNYLNTRIKCLKEEIVNCEHSINYISKYNTWA